MKGSTTIVVLSSSSATIVILALMIVGVLILTHKLMNPFGTPAVNTPSTTTFTSSTTANGTTSATTPPAYTCDEIMTTYSIAPGSSWGTLTDPNIKAWWDSNGCNHSAKPLGCSVLASQYGIGKDSGSGYWGSAKDNIGAKLFWWGQDCGTPSGPTTSMGPTQMGCAELIDTNWIFPSGDLPKWPSDWGLAATSTVAQNQYYGLNCNYDMNPNITPSFVPMCKELSDTYGMSASNVSNYPSAFQTAWKKLACPTAPKSYPDFPHIRGTGQRVVSELRTNSNGKKVLYRNGTPSLALGATIRIDNYWQRQELAIPDYPFAWARQKLACLDVQIPLWWSRLEPHDQVYDWSDLIFCIKSCEANNIQMELLWYSIPPQWLMKQPELYWNAVKKDSTFGTQLCVINSNFRQRETMVLQKLAKFLDGYDVNGTVVGIQVQNEPSANNYSNTDRCYCTYCNTVFVQRGYTSDLVYAREQLALWLEASALPFKTYTSSTWFTRVNFISTLPGAGWDQDVQTTRSLAPHVDLISYDNYSQSQASNWATLTTYFNQGGNTQHVAEQPGNATDIHLKLCDILQMGGVGMSIYHLTATDVDTEGYACVMADGSLRSQYLSQLWPLYATITGMQYWIATSGLVTFVNGSGKTSQNFSGSVTVGGVAVGYQTSTGCVGILCLDSSSRIGVAVVGSGSATVSFGSAKTGTQGMYDPVGLWQGASNLGTSSSFTLQGYTVCAFS